MMSQHNPELPKPEAVIPHRPPHLWLDGINELKRGEFARGFWLPGDEHFEGHFDGMPLLPGVKQIESLAQLGAYTVMEGSDEPPLVLFRTIETASFESPVRPGQELDVAIEIVDKSTRDFKGSGVVMVGGVIACNATITGALLSQRAARRMLGR